MAGRRPLQQDTPAKRQMSDTPSDGETPIARELMPDIDTIHTAQDSQHAVADGRVCRMCKTFKPASEMAVARSCKGGIRPQCKECWNTVARSKFVSDEAHRERVQAWRAANQSKQKQIQRAQHEKHKEKRNADCRAYRQVNLEAMRERGRMWAKLNPARANEITAQRRAAKVRATPIWARDEFEQLVMGEAYRLAVMRTDATGVDWHVDHSVPLRSDRVCGLHCAANLQVIPASVNRSKNNLWWPDMFATN
jgi:hypothetical protein